MLLCTRCKKRPAVVFVSNGMDSQNPQGLCLVCAKELGIKPIDDMMKKMDGTERKTGKEGEPVYHKDRKGRWTHTGSYDAVQKQGPKGGGGISISFFGAAIMTFLL